MTTYPIKIRCSKFFLEELSQCEEGSYEDMQYAQETGCDEVHRPLETHTHVVARRHKTILEMRSIEEVIDVFYSICTGTIQVEERYDWSGKRCPTAKCQSIARQLRPIILDHFSDDPKKQSRYARYWPDGY